MKQFWRSVAHLPEFAVAGVFFTLWMIGEAGRSGVGEVAYGLHLENLLPWMAPYLLISVAIALSRTAPRVAHGALLLMFVLAATAPVMMLASTSWPAYLGVVIAVGIMGSSRRRRLRWLTLGLGILYGLLIDWLMVWRYGGGDLSGNSIVSWAGLTGYTGEVPARVAQEQFDAASAYAGTALGILAVTVMTVSWLIGFTTRAVRDRFASVRSQVSTQQALVSAETQLAVADERGRIARDLHDILAHSLTVVVAQAEGLESTRTRSDAQVDASLTVIASAARAALGDIRLVVEGLRAGAGEPGAPVLADVDPLIDTMRTQGLTVERTDFGTAGLLGAGAQIAVFRIVQEALTNALAHGGVGSSVRIGFDWRGPGLAATIVSTAGASGGVQRSGAGGHGIVGMQERATIAGGWVSAGVDEDGFRVTAFVPYPAASATEAAA